jgi:ubiquinone/menaquinone biosynthesis C-methylase UbiE
MCNSADNYQFRKHPLIGQFNSWLLAKFEDDFHEETGPMKRERMKDLQGTVVEIGPGNGINLRYYSDGVKVIAVEPNPYMHTRLHERAALAKAEVEIKGEFLHDLRIADNSIDAVVCTLVLCTVPDPESILQEVLRILKPGGKYVFVEHVAAPQGSVKRKMQNLLFYPWKYLFEGCHTNRNTDSLLQSVGFSRIDMECFDSRAMPAPVTPNIVGVAQK